MVKFKSRYILLEIIGQSSTTGKHVSYRIKKEEIASRIMKETSHLFGDIGSGKLQNFQVKYANEITNLVIIRISRESLKMLQTVLFFINEIEGKEVRFRIIHVSGTIKKIEEKAKLVLTFWVEKYELNEKIEKTNYLLDLKEKEENNKNGEGKIDKERKLNKAKSNFKSNMSNNSGVNFNIKSKGNKVNQEDIEMNEYNEVNISKMKKICSSKERKNGN